jgi:hypothetical protein
MKRLAAILAALALLAGCGGGGGNGGGGGDVSNGGSDDKVGNDLAFEMGFQQCNGYSVSDLATTYNTEKTPEAVADAVAKTTPAPPKDLASVRAGCLAGFKK